MLQHARITCNQRTACSLNRSTNKQLIWLSQLTIDNIILTDHIAVNSPTGLSSYALRYAALVLVFQVVSMWQHTQAHAPWPHTLVCLNAHSIGSLNHSFQTYQSDQTIRLAIGNWTCIQTCGSTWALSTRAFTTASRICPFGTSIACWIYSISKHKLYRPARDQGTCVCLQYLHADG